MKSPIRKAMHHPVYGSAIFEEGDEIPKGWYDSPADFEAVVFEPPAVATPTEDEDSEPIRKGGWPKGKARK